MADELIVMPRRFDQPVIADKMQMHGSHVRSGTDNTVTAPGTYVVTDGVEYVHLFASANIWYRVSPAGTGPVAKKDEYLAAGADRECSTIFDPDLGKSRKLQPGDKISIILA